MAVLHFFNITFYRRIVTKHILQISTGANRSKKSEVRSQITFIGSYIFFECVQPNAIRSLILGQVCETDTLDHNH